MLSADLNMEVVRDVGTDVVLTVEAKAEENGDTAVDGSWVLSGLLGAGGELGFGEVSRGTSVETVVLKVLLMEVVAVVWCVITGGAMCGPADFSWVKAARRKAQVKLRMPT